MTLRCVCVCCFVFCTFDFWKGSSYHEYYALWVISHGITSSHHWAGRKSKTQSGKSGIGLKLLATFEWGVFVTIYKYNMHVPRINSSFSHSERVSALCCAVLRCAVLCCFSILSEYFQTSHLKASLPHFLLRCTVRAYSLSGNENSGRS